MDEEYTEDLIQQQFKHHPPNGNQIERYQIIRDKAKELALVINRNCPECIDKAMAIRKVREAVMTANAAIAIGEADTPGE